MTSEEQTEKMELQDFTIVWVDDSMGPSEFERISGSSIEGDLLRLHGDGYMNTVNMRQVLWMEIRPSP